MSEKLKPCPFCGSTDVHLRGRIAFCITCDNCGGKGGGYPTIAGALKYWNRRAEVKGDARD